MASSAASVADTTGALAAPHTTSGTTRPAGGVAAPPGHTVGRDAVDVDEPRIEPGPRIEVPVLLAEDLARTHHGNADRAHSAAIGARRLHIDAHDGAAEMHRGTGNAGRPRHGRILPREGPPWARAGAIHPNRGVAD